MKISISRVPAYFNLLPIIISLHLFFLILFFSTSAIYAEIGAASRSASPFYSYTAEGITKTIMVDANIRPFVEIDTNQFTNELIIRDIQYNEVMFSTFTVKNNEPVIITFSGVENLIPSIELNNEKGIRVPVEALNSRIYLMYAVSPLFTDYLKPEELNDKSFVIPYSEYGDNIKYNINMRIITTTWDPVKQEGSYPYIWHEDPDGFIITLTFSP